MNIAESHNKYFILILLMLVTSVYAEGEPQKENFRFALPSHYEVIAHDLIPEFNAASVVLAPTGRGQVKLEEGEVERRTLRVQTYLAENYPGDFVKRRKNPRKLLYDLVNTQLEKECSKHSLESGVIRKSKGQVRINWWTNCLTKAEPGVYRFERGRYFLSESGAYLLSHINRTTKGNHRYDTREVKWFDKYLYNSGFCVSGQDCGSEGELLTAIFKRK